MALFRKMFWFALFVVSTFGFVVLFDYGTVNYFKNAKTEYQNLKQAMGWQPKPRKDESDKTDGK